ncbi:MAG: (deoxy)nucleoside triphosphate pyrophosphohydrolase [Bacteroidales bacterium]
MIRVTCAIIRNEENEILIVQRGEDTDHPLKWEFPGGKINEGESEEECIIREIREELAIDIVICSRLENVDYDYGIKHILLIPFVCDTLDDLPVLSEHLDFKWLAPSRLLEIDFSEADIIVARNYLNELPMNGGVPVNSSGDVDNIVDDEELRSMVTTLMGMKNAEWVATSAIDNLAIFKKLLEYSYSDDRNLAFRASWILTKVCDKYPEIINPFLPGIVEKLKGIDNESAERSFLRIISLSEIKDLSVRHHGLLADHCFAELRSGFSAIAITAYSMEILYKLALIYPELANELSATINMLGEEGSAGIISRGKIVLKKLAEIPTKPGSSLT